ncbi:MAG: hypothetical protein AAF674_10200 [Pseudomonadota bacterium]
MGNTEHVIHCAVQAFEAQEFQAKAKDLDWDDDYLDDVDFELGAFVDTFEIDPGLDAGFDAGQLGF